MTETPTITSFNQPPAHVYETTQPVGWQAAGFLAGGAAMLVGVLVMFVLLLLAPNRSSGPDYMPGLLGGLSVVWIGMLVRGVALLRGVVRVVLDDAAVTLEGFVSRRSVPWRAIGRIEHAKRTHLFGGKSYHVLVLRGAGDKPLGEVPNTIGNFDALAAELAARSAAAAGHATYDPATDEQRRQAKAARSQRWATIGFAVFTLLMAAGFGAGVYEELHLRRYATDGLRTGATIERRFMRRVTPYVEYAFVDAAGRTHRREVMMEQPAWDALAGETTVPVEYLPSDPAWNRPVAGEDAQTFGGSFLLVTGAGMALFGLCFVLLLFGFDLKSEDNVFTLTRGGRVIRTWGKPKTPATPWMAAAPPAAAATASPPASEVMEVELLPETWPADDRVAFPAPPPAGLPPVPSFGEGPRKPRGLIALGVFCIVLGALGLLFGVARLALASRATAHLERTLGPVEVPWWVFYWNLADAVLAAGLLVTGIGLVMLKPWSRPIGLIVGALQITSGLGAIVAAVWSMSTWPEQSGPDSMIPIAAGVAAVIWHVLGLVLPVVLAIVLARRGTAEALEASSATAGATSASPLPARS